ncbi:hypothetical protein N7478_002387 [Penicillium angulare]|uniref:uncharacterized protein n=1 Tax=Penicillium angulare TaxID=116970 RepID=UPI00253FF790|nr:uncharacterized protein N7478_002387 [Penicillium angulare]KAJ5286701.1 hypothetical protein N7478_002387 [Penicillium angulare]
MAPHRVHVAVLDTDVPCLPVYSKRGLYSSQFRVLLQAAAERINKNANVNLRNGPLSVHVTAFDAVGGSLPPLECLRTSPFNASEIQNHGPFGPFDAILITGSINSTYDSDPWIKVLESYIQTVHSAFPNVKLFGSCFGHQLIAQALLSQPNSERTQNLTHHVEKSAKGFEMGIHPITLSESFTSHFPVFDESTKPFRVQLIHGDIVVPTPIAKSLAAASGVNEVPLPSPWMSIGKSAACDIQGLYCPGRVLSYQGHFEFDSFSNRELCIEFARRANWPADLLSSYVEQIERSRIPGAEDDDDDSRVAAEAVLLFFAGEDGDQAGPMDQSQVPAMNKLKSISAPGFDVLPDGYVASNGMLTPPID